MTSRRILAARVKNRRWREERRIERAYIPRRMAPVTVWTQLTLHYNAHDSMNLFITEDKYYFEYRDYYRKEGKRSEMYRDREYAMSMYRKDIHGSRIRWVETFNL